MNNFNSHNSKRSNSKDQSSENDAALREKWDDAYREIKKELRRDRVTQIKQAVGAMVIGVGIGVSIGTNMAKPAATLDAASLEEEMAAQQDPGSAMTDSGSPRPSGSAGINMPSLTNDAPTIRDATPMGEGEQGEHSTSEAPAARPNRQHEEAAANVDTLRPVDYDKQTVDWGYTVWQTIKDTEADIASYNEEHPYAPLSGHYDDQTIMADIQRANLDKDLDKLYVGDTIVIPDYTPDGRSFVRYSESAGAADLSEVFPSATDDLYGSQGNTGSYQSEQVEPNAIAFSDSTPAPLEQEWESVGNTESYQDGQLAPAAGETRRSHTSD